MVTDTVGWNRLTKSGKAVPVPCKVWGFIPVLSASTGYITVYDGQDATSGRLFGELYAGDYRAGHCIFGRAVRFDSGVYIDFTSNVSGVTVLWEPAD